MWDLPHRKGAGKMKAYITKYALTAGIIETNLAEMVNVQNHVIRANIGTPSNYFKRTEWQRERESAILRANIMRRQRIDALENQIKRLEGLVFK
jgi:hypothetical protein